MTMRYQPLADKLIVKPVEENRVTSGGLVVPDAAQNNKFIAYGTVLAVGFGRVNAEGKVVPLNVKVGDLLCFPRKAAAPLPVIHPDLSESVVLLLREGDCIAIVHDMPVPSVLLDITGAPLSMMPTSRSMPDSAGIAREELELAQRAGFDVSDHDDEPNGMTG